MPPDPHLDAMTFVWRLGATLFLLIANGFFVAAEFALVKVNAGALETLAAAGSRRARVAQHIHSRMDQYLSACQLGITISSLILGWLAEPAIAELLLAAAGALGFEVSSSSPWVHGIALAVALSIVTLLHMTIGEQAPKIWAISRAEWTALQAAYPMWAFAVVFRPFIWVVNEISNSMVRLFGISAQEIGESSYSIEELKHILSSSAQAGHISGRQLQLAENIFGIIGLKVRHILVPRVDIAYLSLKDSPEENLKIIRDTGHSRFPLCTDGLDEVIGFIHAKDVMSALADGDALDFEELARKPSFVPDSQPLSRLILLMQRTRSHSSVVVDEHGTAIGLAFLEDALEEIVGPIRDEFDEEGPDVAGTGGGAVAVNGALSLPEAADILDLPDLGEESDTIGGYVVSLLGRLPRNGDTLELGNYQVTIDEVSRRRVVRLIFQPRETENGGEEEPTSNGAEAVSAEKSANG